MTKKKTEEEKSLEYLTKEGFTVDDVKQLVKGLQTGAPVHKNYRVGKSSIRLGVSGDYHLGHEKFDVPLMDFYIRETKKENVDAHLNLGDLLDGWYQNRPASIFEQVAHGFDQQVALAVKHLRKLDAPLFFITGNHSYNTFVRGAGVEAGPIIEDKLKALDVEANYLGNGEGDIVLSTGTNVKLLHPDGGTAYALSYRPQKIIESFSGGEKPELLLIGHFHKMEQLYYRNVHAFQTGTFCGQTKFMRGKSIPAHKGFWIIDIDTRDGGQIDRLTSRLYPAY